MSNPGLSTRNPEALPPPDRLRRLCQSLALLDAIFVQEWEFRYYSFNAQWNVDKGLQMGSMRNGCGDEFFVVFSPHGAAIVGCGHESALAGAFPETGEPPAGLFEGMPSELFEISAEEPAFSPKAATFCLWYSNENPGWRIGPVSLPDTDDPDGSAGLLSIFDEEPETYAAWAEEYYEVEPDREAVQCIYHHTPLTQALVSALNPERRLQDMAEDLEEIDYPADDLRTGAG